jgi:capsular polysaccharide biosynthesis protein
MEEFELRNYWLVIRKWWLMVILIPIVSAIVSGAISYYVIQPKYEATTTILVNQPSTTPGLQFSEVQANQAIVGTYTAIIQSESIEQTVLDDLNLPFSVDELDSMISVNSPSGFGVIFLGKSLSSYVPDLLIGFIRGSSMRASSRSRSSRVQSASIIKIGASGQSQRAGG